MVWFYHLLSNKCKIPHFIFGDKKKIVTNEGYKLIIWESYKWKLVNLLIKHLPFDNVNFILFLYDLISKMEWDIKDLSIKKINCKNNF